MIHDKFSEFYLANSYVIFSSGHNTKVLTVCRDVLDF
jgi:hypothetical protein